jgi:PelA/Pel-15E family pectate lyase
MTNRQMRRLARAIVGVSLLAAGSARAQGALPSEGDAAPLVSEARIAALPLAQQPSWRAYLAQSRRDRLADSMLIVAELREIGATAWVQPKVVPDFRITPAWNAALFASDSARRMAVTMLSFQTPSGGWTKHADMFGPPRAKGVSFFSETAGWDYIATIDNYSTTTQLEFLARLIAAQPTAAECATWRAAFARGVQYLLRAQYPSGGWPQVYPLQGGYHDATTYNDDATINVLQLLGDVSAGRFAWVSRAVRAQAARAVARGLSGVLADQVVLNGERTVWGQQHDPFTRAPVKARSYELAGLTGGESAGILSWLMSIERPSPAVVAAVHAGARWLTAHRVEAIRYDSIAGTYVPDPQAPPLWARIYELPSLRPVMANRDGVPRYAFADLTDRRTGYAWYVNRPVPTLAACATWSRLHPLPSR